VLQLLVTANVVPSSLMLVTLMETIHFSEISVLTRVTWHSIPEDGILHSRRRQNLKSYEVKISFNFIQSGTLFIIIYHLYHDLVSKAMDMEIVKTVINHKYLNT
jgi:Na+/H+ antiporter NhaC